MKILFTLAGIGYGHATRIHALIDEFKQRFPNCQIEIMAYGFALKYFFNKHKTTALYPYKYVGDMTLQTIGTIKANWKFPATFFKNLKLIKNKVDKFKPDILITDGEFSANKLYGEVKFPIISIHNLDFGLFENYISLQKKLSVELKAEFFSVKKILDYVSMKSDKIIIPSFLGKKDFIGKVKFVDPIVRKQPTDLPSKYQLLKELNVSTKTAIVQTGSISFGKSLVEDIIKISKDFDYEFLIFGRELNFKNKNIRNIPFTEDILKYLKVSNFAISLAGFSFLSDALVYKLPVFIVPIKAHLEQMVNAWLLNKKNLAKSYDWKYKLTSQNLKQQISLFLEKKEQIRNNLKKLKYGNGAKQAVDIILQ